MASDLEACLSSAQVSNLSISYSPSYLHLLDVSIQNLRFTDPSIPKPLAIIIPSTKSQLQSSVLCCRRAGVSMRVRSGGHSYEGQSYISDDTRPFAIIDMMNLNAIHVDISSNNSWVESGATLGQVYYTVSTLSNGSLAVSAGSCSTVGTGGHISGGGFGLLSRKYGLAADTVLDALLINHEGKVFDRMSMGPDVFWAIRGGGGGSWGVVYAWKLRLVPVPSRVTRFTLQRRCSAGEAASLLFKWQLIAPKLPDEFYLSAGVTGEINGTITTISISFLALFLGPKYEPIAILGSRFPELGLRDSDCVEESWLNSAAHFAGLDSTVQLNDHNAQPKTYYKAKSDYVKTRISKRELEVVLDKLVSVAQVSLILDPYGGVMSRIRSDHLPFPHRDGNLFSIQYLIEWTAEDEQKGERGQYIEKLRGFYEFMATYVSKNPRGAYVNYMDLDLGTSVGRVEEDRVWGERYFMGNFYRLVKAKTLIDHDNVFNNQQSIPPMSY
ncbi:hypothetical protein J5N97_025521 [Dioscorea zingiberensis]|uniref:FAD-binding PCMH-type domain-containing protein n=1 Tax=Dioscorea zingiberensis TaxID=325984 RepID=A0A9D5C8V6_9LILI|nr:hypothetical protein J5N97_025521 [Dioscorea zingiberensis]